MIYQGKADLTFHASGIKPPPELLLGDHSVAIERVLHRFRITIVMPVTTDSYTHVDAVYGGQTHRYLIDGATHSGSEFSFVCTPIYKADLPSFQVVREARDFLNAALLLEQEGLRGNSDLLLPAAMNAGLASEQYLKSFLVETDPDCPSFVRLSKHVKGDKHDLAKLYEQIPPVLKQQLDAVSESVEPDFPLEARIQACSVLFTKARYGYEADSLKVLRSEVFELAPHLDKVLTEMTRVVSAQDLANG
ncbi:hypothetical protein [Pseudomonas sp. UBA5568]|uniref:hypothetical protein n=1 Tax=Pseudomonas sp. UBA5568 TaxID=1947319 RepID=UPI002593106C|nr:hypothetical protein [Pseudomonas sp. UBA5568]